MTGALGMLLEWCPILNHAPSGIIKWGVVIVAELGKMIVSKYMT